MLIIESSAGPALFNNRTTAKACRDESAQRNACVSLCRARHAIRSAHSHGLVRIRGATELP
jgi:hypothetical protein